jgi:hypothetical protein
MNLSNSQILIIVIISIFFVIFNYYTKLLIEGLSKEDNEKLQKEREKSEKNYFDIRDNYNIRYHVTEDVFRKKFPILLKEDNITFQKDGETHIIKRLPVQNRATYFEPGDKHFVSNYVPNYEERIILSKKRSELNFNNINNM